MTNEHVSSGTKEHAVPLSTTACHASTSGPHGTGDCDGLLKLGDRVVRSMHCPSAIAQPSICAQKLVDTSLQLAPESTTPCHFSTSASVRISTRRSTWTFKAAHSLHVSSIAASSVSATLTRSFSGCSCEEHSAFASLTAAVTFALHASVHPSSEKQSQMQM